MSEQMYLGTPAPRPRPAVVTIASYLLYLSAATLIISAVLSLSTIGTTRRVYADLYSGTASSGTESVIVAASVIGVVIDILVAAGLVILAIYDNRGRQGARITTWAIGGLFLCCSGFGLLGNVATNAMNLDTGDTAGPSASEVTSRLSDALPGWYTPLSTALTVLTVLALLGAVILLALPAANAFFRKPQAAWDPLNPYPGYPGQPAAYPGYPSQSPYPAYPGPAPGRPPFDPAPGPAGGGDPHTGSVPPTDPWSAPGPPPSSQPPSSPPPGDKPWRSPTDPA